MENERIEKMMKNAMMKAEKTKNTQVGGGLP